MDATIASMKANATNQVATAGNLHVTGTDTKNYSGNYGMCVGVPLGQGGSNQPSLGVGISASQNFGASNGQSSKSQVDYGVGVSVRFPV